MVLQGIDKTIQIPFHPFHIEIYELHQDLVKSTMFT